ncbi:MAG: hypothetical protein Q8P67_10010, partial [archaeon]|nr:hypothetical protein [archaeon]
WAPRGMDANAKDGYLKEGYFLSSRNHPFSFSSKDSTFLPPSKRGKATSEPLVYIRSHRDIVARTVSFEVSVDAVSWSPSIIFSNIPADVPLSPTIVLHTEGSQFKIIEDVFKLLPHKQDKHSFRSLLVHGR